MGLKFGSIQSSPLSSTLHKELSFSLLLLPPFTFLPLLFLLPFSSPLPSPLSPNPCDPDPEQMICYLKYNPLNLSFVVHSLMLQEISQERQNFLLLLKKITLLPLKTLSSYFPFATFFTLPCLALKSYKPRLGSFIIHGMRCFEPFNFL